MKENKVVYNFRISKLDTTPTKSLNFYNGSKKIVLWNYIISAGGGAEIGDYLVKDRCAKILYIKRKNAEGKLVAIDSSNNIRYFANLVCD